MIGTVDTEDRFSAEDASKGSRRRTSSRVYSTRCFLFTKHDLIEFTEGDPEFRELLLSEGHPSSFNRCFEEDCGWLPEHHYWFIIGRYGSDLLEYWKKEDSEIYAQIVEQARRRVGFILRIIDELGEEPIFAVLDEEHRINEIDHAFLTDVEITENKFDKGVEPPEFDFNIDSFYRFRKKGN